MVALEPDNMKWRMEEQYADTNLGVLLFDQRRFAEARRNSRAFRNIEALCDRRSAKSAIIRSRSPNRSRWLADAQQAEGKLDEATAARERHVALLNEGLAKSGGDVSYRQKLIPAERALGPSISAAGRRDLALEHYRRAIAQSEALIDVEQTNSVWLDFGARARFNLAELVLTSNPQEAASQAKAGCDIYERLLARNSTVSNWRAGRRDCMLMHAYSSLRGAKDDASAFKRTKPLTWPAR